MTGVADVLPCDACVRRAWLLAAVAGHLEIAWRSRRPLRDVLALPDRALIQSLGGDRAVQLERAWEGADPVALRHAWSQDGVVAVCRHDPRYPARLRTGSDAPAVLFCAGRVEQLTSRLGGEADAGPATVAIVGTRRPLPEAQELARTLGRGMAAAGVTVVSGMAMGIDAAAHQGALSVGGPTVAVLACGPERAYPRSVAAVHAQLLATQLVVSELHPGTTPWRWAFRYLSRKSGCAAASLCGGQHGRSVVLRRRATAIWGAASEASRASRRMVISRC